MASSSPARPLTIRARILIAFWSVLTVVSGLSAYFLYETQKTEYLNGIDEKLVAGAVMARALVGPDFHDRIVDRDSVSKEDYLAIVDTYNDICLRTGFQYLWSNLFLDDGTVVFTTGTSTSKHVAKGDHALFFDVHSDPAAFDAVKETKAPTFSSFHNEWGDGRMVLMPYQDKRGRTYVFGASISIDELAARLHDTALKALVVFIVMSVVGTVVSLAIASAISNPVKKLNRVAREIADGKYGLTADDVKGGAELVSLAETVNGMSAAILANYRDLDKTVRTLEETRDELRRSRDELEVRVVERTRDLRTLTQAVEQGPHMVVVTDLTGSIEYVNPRFCELTGYAREEVIGRNPRLLKSGDTPEEVYDDLWGTLLAEGTWSGEIKDRCKNGQVFWASMTVSAVHDEEGKTTHYVAIHEDITERKLAEINIRQAKEEAETASRAKTEMLANMSHELRTPLNAILGFSDTILQGVFGEVGNEKYHEYIKDIHHSGTHLLELINDVLDVSAIEANKLELSESEVDLDKVVESCIRLVSPRAKGAGLELRMASDGRVGPVHADERRIKQALLNLLSNAVKFTPEGGIVTTTLRRIKGRGIEIEVSDTGIGMTRTEMTKALERFGQADGGLARKFDGTGLGLPLTKGLIELHGGEFFFESRKGHGTTVTLTLPEERVLPVAV